MILASSRNSTAVRWWVYILLGLFLTGCNEPTSGPPFDPHMAGLKLARWIEGDDAIKAINKLHGMPIDVERGFIAHYEGTYDKATVWVSEASTEDLAKRQIAVMMRKMQNNIKSPFGHYRTLNIKGLEVSAFDGMGQVHYVFRDKRWVYWASADERRIDEILRHIRKNRY